MQDDEGLRPATRLLLLSSLPAHAQYLQDTLKPHHNFATMQMRGLGNIGLAFPEFRQADAWHDFAIKQLSAELQAQIYPDGVQKELTVGYHCVALGNFNGLADDTRKAGREVPPVYRTRLEAMFDYLAGCMGPDGIGPLNNDSDSAVLPPRLLSEADTYSRPDWVYVGTFGVEGEAPNGLPSRFYTWPGQLISRDHWGADTQWSFFDFGVYGVSHQHNDKLHLSIRAHGRPLLTDSGRFAYQGAVAEKFRKDYALHSRGHNVILIDGMGQQAYTPEAQQPHFRARVAEGFDFAVGTSDDGFDTNPSTALEAWNGLSENERVAALGGVHTRAVVYLRGQGWVVLDQVRIPGEHTLAPLWHFRPDCTVTTEGATLRTTDEGQGNLRLQPVGPVEWQVKIVKGQEEPTLQGWFSETYGKVEASPCAVYESRMTDAATFGWVINTDKGEVTAPEVEWIEAQQGVARLHVSWPVGPAQTLTVVLDEAALPVMLPDGRSLFARLLVEVEGKAPDVACGWLYDARGEIIAADPIPAELALNELVQNLAVEKRDVSDDSATGHVVLPLANTCFDMPLQVTVTAREDTGTGWRLSGLPAELSLAPGQQRDLTLNLEQQPGKVRYPLPELTVTLALPDQDAGDAPLRQTRNLIVPMFHSRPTFTLQPAAAAPTLDGTLGDPIWQRDPDVPVLGRMDLSRSVEPVTQVWAAYDKDALYLAFRCEEPEMEKLKADAAQRDEAVYLDDSVEIMLKPDGDGADRDYYQVIVNTQGVVFDGQGFNNTVNLEHLTTATSVGSDHWIAEIAIAWQDLGLDGPPEGAGILLGRNRQVTGTPEIFQFPVSPQGNHQPAMFAKLVRKEGEETMRVQLSVDHSVELAPPVVVALSKPDERRWGVHQFPAFSRLPDGSVLIMYADAKDASETHGQPAPTLVSTDQGTTWRPYDGALKVLRPHFSISEVYDGQFLVAPAHPYLNYKEKSLTLPDPVSQGNTYGSRLYYAVDEMPAPLQSYFGTLKAQRYDPVSGGWQDEVIRYDTDNRIAWRGGDSAVFPQTFFERPLLRHKGELFYADYRAQYRMSDGRAPMKGIASCMVSTDNGHSFTRRSIIAEDLRGNNLKGEPQLARTADGRLVCVVRQADQDQKPMQICWSSDSGRSWTELHDLFEFGVWPCIELLGNKTLVLTYGRPGVHLRFSLDGNGERWSEPVTLIAGDARQPQKHSCGYTSLLALDDSSFLMAYSDFSHTFPDGKIGKAILVRKITVIQK